MTTEQITRQLLGIATLVNDSIREAGPLGIPSGHLYAILMAHGCSLEQYEALIGALLAMGMIRKSGDCLYSK